MNCFTYYSSLYGQTYSRRWLKGCGPHLNSLLIKFIELALKSYKLQYTTFHNFNSVQMPNSVY